MHGLLALIHTVPPLIDVFARIVPQVLPTVKPIHILDEPLLEIIRRRGALTSADADRLQSHVLAAEEVGALAALVTCSTVSPCVDTVRPRVRLPIFKIDEAMIAQAVRRGGRIGAVATNKTTLEPTRRLLADRAQSVGARIAVELVLVEDALSALLAGDGERHDKLVVSVVHDLVRRSDVVVLAQASMARVLDAVPEEDRIGAHPFQPTPRSRSSARLPLAFCSVERIAVACWVDTAPSRSDAPVRDVAGDTRRV